MPFDRQAHVTPTTCPLPKRGKWSRLTAHQINDFRPGIDRVERDKEGRAWVVDGQGHYAAVEVWGDQVPTGYAESLDKLTDEQRWGLYRATGVTPYLSPEGREERLQVLRRKVSFRFEVVSPVPRGH